MDPSCHDDDLDSLKKKFYRGLAVITLSSTIGIGMSVLTLIYGWGLQPKNWGWIIGAGFFGMLFSKLLLQLDSND